MKTKRNYTKTSSSRNGSINSAWRHLSMPPTNRQSVRDREPELESVAQAFLLAKYFYGSSESPLIFTKAAEEAATQSPFWRPVRVFRYLEQLWVFASRWSENNGALGMSFFDYFASVGLRGYRADVSQTAQGKYGSEYRVVHDGRVYHCGHHFTLGAKNANTCLSIHFDTDSLTRRVLITHCGRHLKNTQS